MAQGCRQKPGKPSGPQQLNLRWARGEGLQSVLINYIVFIFTLLFSAPGVLLVKREGTLIN